MLSLDDLSQEYVSAAKKKIERKFNILLCFFINASSNCSNDTEPLTPWPLKDSYNRKQNDQLLSFNAEFVNGLIILHC